MIYRIQRWTRSVAVAVCVVVAAAVWAVRLETQPAPAQPSFAQFVEELFEPSGYFDTDNLISNEKSYLHVLPHLEQSNVTGGVYSGVGNSGLSLRFQSFGRPPRNAQVLHSFLRGPHGGTQAGCPFNVSPAPFNEKRLKNSARWYYMGTV